jgi:solute carrier family 35, member E3
MQAGFFEPKALPWKSLLDLTVGYVAYIVLGNLSIKLNPVGFYQIIKALIPPAVLLMQSLQSMTMPSLKIIASVLLLTIGVIAATVTDDEVMGNLPGMLVGVICVFATAGYNILAGSKQKQLSASMLLSTTIRVPARVLQYCRCVLPRSCSWLHVIPASSS